MYDLELLVIKKIQVCLNRHKESSNICRRSVKRLQDILPQAAGRVANKGESFSTYKLSTPCM